MRVDYRVAVIIMLAVTFAAGLAIILPSVSGAAEQYEISFTWAGKETPQAIRFYGNETLLCESPWSEIRADAADQYAMTCETDKLQAGWRLYSLTALLATGETNHSLDSDKFAYFKNPPPPDTPAVQAVTIRIDAQEIVLRGTVAAE